MYSARYPLLPLKNVVIFPRNVVTLLVGRTRSIQAVEEAMARDRRIVVTAHSSAETDDPRPDDLYDHRAGMKDNRLPLWAWLSVQYGRGA